MLCVWFSQQSAYLAWLIPSTTQVRYSNIYLWSRSQEVDIGESKVQGRP